MIQKEPELVIRPPRTADYQHVIQQRLLDFQIQLQKIHWKKNFPRAGLLQESQKSAASK